MTTPRIRPLMLAAALLVAAHPASGAPQELLEEDGFGIDLGLEDELETDELLELDLEELLDIEVTVVSRRAESLDGAPAAVYVITGEEIRRAGHASVQEALRMVPGFFVSRWTTAEWDGTIRGFGPGTADANLAYLNQVLVMIDGVVVYTPLFAGMWWGMQDLDIEHIERIEVIRGPSGILWGANAFHGLVNIITKDSAKARGTRLSVRSSADEHFVTMRHGGDISKGITYTAFARRARYDTLNFRGDRGGADLSDIADWGIDSGGVQFDGVTENGQRWRLWARGYDANVDRPFQVAPNVFDFVEERRYGGQASATYDDPESGLSLRAAFVKDRQDQTYNDSTIDIDQIQLEARRTVEVGENASLMFGVGYDRIDSDTMFYTGLTMDRINQNNARVFVSETWRIPAADLAISLGLQAIDNEFSGFDLQPSARLAWTPAGYGTFWASASRAVRTPSIEEESFGGGTLDAESVVAIEAGWRGEVADGVKLDLAVYHNDYDDVRVRFFNPVTFLDTYENSGSGNAHGAELAADLRLTDRWTMRAAYSYHGSSHGPVGLDPGLDSVDAQYPVHMANLRSYLSLGEHWEFDTAGYLVERFDGQDDGPEYWRADARLGWRPSRFLRVSLGVQGANDPARSEFGSEEVRRLAYLSLDVLR